MKLELSSLPAVHVGAECVLPQRSTWDLIVTADESALLGRVAEAIAERGRAFPLDAEEIRLLAEAVEIVQLMARRVVASEEAEVDTT